MAWTLTSSGSPVRAVVALIFIVPWPLRRADGRLELQLGGRATRPDRLRAALLTVGGAGVAVGLLAFVGLVADGMPADGSGPTRAGPIASILLVTGVGAVCAGGDRSGRGRRLPAAVLGVFFLVAAIGDATGAPQSCGALAALTVLGLRPDALGGGMRRRYLQLA